MVDNWIKQEDSNKKAYCIGSAGLEGYAIVTTASAELIKLDGKSSVKELIEKAGLANILDAGLIVTDPEGGKYDLDYVPTEDDTILLTNVTEGA